MNMVWSGGGCTVRGEVAAAGAPAPGRPAPDPRAGRLNILMLRVRLLWPLDVGSKIRTARMVEAIGREHDVTLVAYRYPEDTDEHVDATARLCHRLVTVPLPAAEARKGSPRFYADLARNLLDPRPYMIAKYSTAAMRRAVGDLYRGGAYDLVLCDFPHACEALRPPGPVDAPFVLFQHNVEAAIFEQLAGRARSPAARTYLRLQARKMRAYEGAQCRRARRVIAVSEVDRDAYERRYGLSRSRCDVVPTGVDTDYFRPEPGVETPGRLVFTGSMDWMANQDAMHFFVGEVLPRVRARRPDATLHIVGRNPPPDVRRLATAVPGVCVTGTVPDIRPHVHAAEVYVAPLRVGSGTRLKLVEAMAMGKPIVSTSRAAEGLPVQWGRDMLVEDDPADFAAAVVDLLGDRRTRRTLGDNARRLAERGHGWAHVGRVFSDLCRRAAAEGAAAAAAGRAGAAVEGEGGGR